MFKILKSVFGFSDSQERLEISRELGEVEKMLSIQEEKLNLTDDDDLLEALIFECKALEKRHSYLLKRAKELKLELSPYERIKEANRDV
ncbi:MAG: hypothetical protein LBR74_02700 [Eubacterium sp.]|jgi:hypothetical protein|nr:hypothetical protein [Eubacterium sp.]